MGVRITGIFCVVVFLAGTGFAQPTQVSITGQPASPLRIVSVVPVNTASMEHGAEPYNYTVANVSDQDIYLWTIQWNYETPQGQPVNRHTFSAQSSLQKNGPVLRAGEARTYTMAVVNRGYPVLRPTVDLVLLADGTFFGQNKGNWINKSQAELTTIYSVKKRILARLESEEPEPVMESLREDLAILELNLDQLLNVRIPRRPQ